MKRFMEISAIGIFLGSLTSYYLEINYIWLIAILFACAALFLYSRSELLLFFAVSFSLGLLIMNLSENSSILEDYDKKTVDIIGTIEEVIKTEDEYSSYYIKISYVGDRKVNERCLLYLKGESKLEIGTTIKAFGKIRTIAESGNPKLFSYRDYLKVRRISTGISVDEKDIKKLDIEPSIGLRIRRSAEDFISSNLPLGMSEEASNLMTGVVLGKNTDEGGSVKSFRKLGLSHLLAISGLHMGIICVFILSIFRLIGIKRNYSLIITLAILAIYLHIIAYKASAIRSFLMISIGMSASILHKGYNPRKSLAFAVFFIVLLNPYRVLDIGLLMSIMAMIAIIYFYPDFNIIDTADFEIMTSFKMLIIINLALFPLIIFYYNEFNLLTLLANLLVVPLFTIALVSVFIKLLVSLISTTLSFILGNFIDTIIGIIESIIKSMDFIEFTNLKMASPGLELIALYILMILIFTRRYEFRNLSYGFKSNIIKVFISLLMAFSITNIILDPLYIDFIDIGQGDAALIRTKAHSAMIDTGGHYDGSDRVYEYILKPYLIKNGVPSVDLVFISHDDADHSGNLKYMYQENRAHNILSSDDSITERFDNAFGLYTGNKFTIGNALIDVVNDGRTGISSNNRSNVLKLSHHHLSILFTGDIESESESKLVKHDIKADILKVAHHGSDTSSARDFLKKVSASNAIISVGRDNPYNHPSKAVLNDLTDLKSRIYRTDEDGRIRIISTRMGYQIENHLPRKKTAVDYLTEPSLYLGLLYFYTLTNYFCTSFKFEKWRKL
ncbi:DNA internalization-related competence protein ComEC/Rec2 [Microaceticoccus formicicus]|uniref:DNA internalization-related competence protein ComEC/Rec2 n=1 Tax=Microaceticoccus formicicus TaxID=3118105 RepID=UPI003CD03EF5|nr:DNA internalization-related competence protein ComEC/Rec2 [Peptoniphilaceae bacterium AMB_02]